MPPVQTTFPTTAAEGMGTLPWLSPSTWTDRRDNGSPSISGRRVAPGGAPGPGGRPVREPTSELVVQVDLVIGRNTRDRTTRRAGGEHGEPGQLVDGDGGRDGGGDVRADGDEAVPVEHAGRAIT